MTRTRDELLAVDAQARRTARTCHDGVVVVEAGAGTGKTSLLVARILVWCLGPGWRKHAPDAADDREVAARLLERLVAITFTDKAAAEMTRRVTEALELVREQRSADIAGFEPAETGADPDDLATRAEALLLCIERLQASTIHAWCQRLLRTFSQAAGLHPQATVDAEQARLPAIVDEVVLGALAAAYGEPGDPDHLALLRHDVGPTEIAEAVTKLAQQDVAAEWLDQDPHPEERLAAFRAALTAPLEELIGHLRETLPDQPTRNLIKACRVLGTLVACQQALPAGDALAGVARAAGELDARIGEFAAGEFTQAEARCFGERATRIEACAAIVAPMLASLRGFDPAAFAAARRVLARLLRDVRARTDALGVLSFQALLQRTHDLLTSDPVVAATLRTGLDQLLVDEFQDTDQLQCGILRAIALRGPPAERPALFLVGDPKQSIYGWRNADLAAYEAFVREALDGRPRQPLLVNFRSVDPVLQEVARICAPLLVHDEGIQAGWEPLLVSERRRDDPGCTLPGHAAAEHWVTWLTDGPKRHASTPADPARELGAAALAHDLRLLHDQHGVAWSACAVLLRSATQVDVYLDALRQAGVPFAIEREGSFYQRREIVDAAALLRAVLDPTDLVALFAMLRAPFCGVPDAALAGLWQAGLPALAAELHGSTSLPEAFEHCVRSARDGLEDAPAHAGWEDSLRDALTALAQLRAALQSQPVDEFLQLLRDRLALPATAAARFLGLHRLANLQRFFHVVEQALCNPERGPEVLLRELRRGLDGLLRAAEGAPGDAGMDAVQVMTVHKSKGLQWPHVYVVDLHTRLPWHERDPERTDVVRQHGMLQARLFGWPSLGWSEVEAQRERVARAEAIRLLYVAATRAADRLVLAGSWPAAARDASSMTKLIEAVAFRTPPDLVALAGAGDADAGRWEDGALWRVPALRALPEREPGTPQPLPLARLLAGAESLHRATEQAVRQQRVPRVAAASTSRIADDAEDPRDPSRSAGNARPRDAAQQLGILLHRLMETVPPAVSDAELRESLFAITPPELQPLAAQALTRLLRGEPWRRFQALGDQILARELPFVVAATGEDAATDALAGAIDLLYFDPARQQHVVADYKTGAPGEQAQHAAQARVYPRAVQRALGLAAPPRFELWYLLDDRIEVVPS